MLIYLDQNALIALGRKARGAEARAKLDAVISSGSVTFVVSLWHLIETANANNITNATELARFIDSLNPLWLLDRHDLLKAEIAEDFYRFVGINYVTTPRATTFSAMYARLLRQPDGPRFQIPAVEFVTQWMNNPEQLRPLQQIYEESGKIILRLRQLKKAEKLPTQLRALAERQLLEIAAPSSTPNGIEVGHELRAEYLNQATGASIPTLAIESAIAEQQWAVKTRSGADRNTRIDKFHLILALPYVDELISDDGFFYSAYEATHATGHLRARLVHNSKFLDGLLGNCTGK